MADNGDAGDGGAEDDPTTGVLVNWPVDHTATLQYANVMALHSNVDENEFVLSFGCFVPTFSGSVGDTVPESEPPIHTIAHLVFTTSRLQDLSDMLKRRLGENDSSSNANGTP